MSETAANTVPDEPRSPAPTGPVAMGPQAAPYPGPAAGPVRTCVGCGERADVEAEADLVRLIVGPGGEIAVDARGGGFGRGAHVHARPECLKRAVERGLSRSAKARVHTIRMDADEQPSPLDARSLALAIRRASDRRVEGLLGAAARSKRVVLGSDAVTYASQRGEAELVVVATDAAAAADLTAVRIAVASGRAVAWGSKERLGAMLLPGKAEAGLAVLAITSRSLAASLRDAVRIADACATVAAGHAIANPSIKGLSPEKQRKKPEGSQASPAITAKGGNSHTRGACAQPPNSGKLGAERGPTEDRGQDKQRGALRPDRRGPGFERSASSPKNSGRRGPMRDRPRGG